MPIVIEYQYDLLKSEGNFIEEIKDRIQVVLSRKGISAKEILSKPDSKKKKELESIGKAVHIVGGKNQEDMIGFIQLLLEKME